MILNGIQVLQLIFNPFAGIPAIEPPQQPTKLLDRLLATRVSLIVKETIADSLEVLNTTPQSLTPVPDTVESIQDVDLPLFILVEASYLFWP